MTDLQNEDTRHYHAHKHTHTEQTKELGREPDLALVLTKAKKFSLRFLFSLTLGTYQVLLLFLPNRTL